jgi:hypothetical protein
MKKVSYVLLICAGLALGSLAVLLYAVQTAGRSQEASLLPRISENETEVADLPSQPTAMEAVLTATRTVVLLPTVSGTVRDAQGPVANAIVQVQGMPNQTTTDANGTFLLNEITGLNPITITAWAPGNYIGWTLLDSYAPDWKGSEGITITLKPYYTSDNSQYDGFSFEGVEGSKACGLCHREYEEWTADAHSQSAQNPRFISMYTGTDINGRQGQPVFYGLDGKPLPLDPAKPHYGPGYKLDNPQRAGNCAACHTPVASKIPNRQNCAWSGCHNDATIERSNGAIDPAVVPLSLTGHAAEGISCDFCHKIGDVILDSQTKLPLPDMPGILSLRLYRPPEGKQLFFGTLVDVSREDTYLPLLSESEYCAACHYGVFGGVVGNGTVRDGTLVYNSYGEWLDSPYSDPKSGMFQTCQDCHMPISDANFMVFAERDGIPRDYTEFHNHLMPGSSDEQLLKNAVTMKSNVTHVGDKLQLEVSVTNDNTGHYVPTDAPIRQMILIITALDSAGVPLRLAEGPVNPSWAGNYTGQPGKVFMKVLKDELTAEMPTGAYWRPVTIVEDTRLAPLATDMTRYTFELSASQMAQVSIRLIFRRAFQSLAQSKGWNDPDILMAEEIIQITR